MKNIQKQISRVIFLLATLVIIIWIFAPSAIPKVETPPVEQVTMISIELKVDDLNLDLSVREGSSALSAMVQARAEGLVFESDEAEGLGAYITAISGVRSNTETNEYWSFYINDELSQVGVSSYIMQGGDVMTWKYEKITF